MPDLLCFGELMLRLSPPDHLRLTQAREFQVHFGGAEANVAVTAAQLGASAGFVTRLPQNALADRALAELAGLGVEITRVVRGGDRIGVYFVEHGVSLRASRILYDRAHSAMAEAPSSAFDWPKILAGARWLHWSGITPALSPAAAEASAAAAQTARSLGLTVSFDVNFRSKLWSHEQAARQLPPLMQHVDLCITSAEEAQLIFGIPQEKCGSEEDLARALCERFGFRGVALTQRRSASADRTEWGAVYYTAGALHRSRRYETGIVDRLGAGDSFSGALLFSLMRGDDPGQAVELAAAVSALKHTISGDYCLVSLSEAEELLSGASAGRVQR